MPNQSLQITILGESLQVQIPATDDEVQITELSDIYKPLHTPVCNLRGDIFISKPENTASRMPTTPYSTLSYHFIILLTVSMVDLGTTTSL